MAPKIPLDRKNNWIEALMLSDESPMESWNTEIFASDDSSALLKPSPSFSTVSTPSLEEMDVSFDVFSPRTTADADTEFSFDVFSPRAVDASGPSLGPFSHENAEALLAKQEREREHQETIARLESKLAAKEKEIEQSATRAAQLLQELRQQHFEKLDKLYTSVHEIDAQRKKKRQEQQQSWWFFNTCVSASPDVHQCPDVVSISALGGRSRIEL